MELFKQMFIVSLTQSQLQTTQLQALVFRTLVYPKPNDLPWDLLNSLLSNQDWLGLDTKPKKW